ncbi:hypothetical protein BO86DRAFT_48008 [Aspergillus japonicus CBS 114.51]|uniref:Only prolin and serin are matching in the corresponding protein n=2 Tax=Aspergillus TaxID=5052 RepID=A0A2V5HG38_ASPV1|nr:hypothetical protein BO86DRAFT_48008 [Aspergillus japonicus CBS 114.51]PYI23379.1 hypothetical protein BO99DRAFT_203559 [Aspergillus violaceofuscus CBS 115571]RAH83365.1 hypothetical protein BO86DRAFT_48008 [Aspergillus japonicus CBS 114.51]
MFKPTQFLDTRRCDSSETMAESCSSFRQPQSPLTTTSSTPVSPAVSLFSAKGHTRFSSSVSSLVSFPGHGTSMESNSRNALTGVKEEPCGERPRDLEEEYFQHFDQGLSVVEDSCFDSFDPADSYDLTDAGLDSNQSPRNRCSDSISGKGLSRIGSRISTISTRWKSKRASDGIDGADAFATHLRSRTNSASSAIVSPVTGSFSRVSSIQVPPSPARTIFEEELSESGTQPIDIVRSSRYSQDDSGPQATTPLLPPFMGDEPSYPAASRVHSPLQSPSVADMTDDALNNPTVLVRRLAGLPSPPLSSKPSVASFSRPRASTVRTVSGDAPPFTLSDPNDEWANKLGHANFTIQPEPYMPEVIDVDSLQQLRTNWDLAQCNFARHLVRTGEHYGITSTIYRLTEEKWEAINREWKSHHGAMLSHLRGTEGVRLDLVRSHCDPCHPVKLPRLHDDKFPELGDGEIVGPMKIAPAVSGSGLCRSRSLKRNFLKFFQDLVIRS